MSLNVFRVVADVSHTVSKCTLIWAIHANASAEGVSLITQALYALIFTTRYLDLFWSHPFDIRGNKDHAVLGIWNFSLKIFYILSSFYILFIMMKVYGRTHERQRAWKLAYGCLAGSAILMPIVVLIEYGGWPRRWFSEPLWNFSEILESVAILPQLLLLRQTEVPTVIDSFYLVTLGCYRFFYIPNWILLGAKGDRVPWVSMVFGIIQTALYIDFAWVYYTRQRVKLRNGAIVDSEDFGKGWLVNRLFKRAGVNESDYDSRKPSDLEDGLDDGADDINRPRRVGSQNGWGQRGISVSADDELPVTSDRNTKGKGTSEERTGMLEDLDDDAEETSSASEWK